MVWSNWGFFFVVKLFIYYLTFMNFDLKRTSTARRPKYVDWEWRKSDVLKNTSNSKENVNINFKFDITQGHYKNQCGCTFCTAKGGTIKNNKCCVEVFYIELEGRVYRTIGIF